jgi:hypothetical protein
MNWSTKILILYLGFVALILTLVFTCFGQKSELEYKDYYSREIKFQDQINAQKNAEQLPEPITYALENGSIHVTFPQPIREGITGTIELMRPSDSSKDLVVTVVPDAQGGQVISNISKGFYKMRISVEQAHIRYFKEATITLR